MSLRLLDIIIPLEGVPAVRDALADQPVAAVWEDAISGETAIIRSLLDSENAEAVCDHLAERFASREGFRLMLLPVEATIPRLEAPEPEPEPAEPAGVESHAARISREELYDDIADTAKLNRVYIAMVVLSAVVAAIGLLRDNVAILIGAMVIAPLLGPNVALALGTTLGDMALVRRAVWISAVGIAVGFAISLTLGLMLPVDPAIGEIASRTEVGLGDLALALAAGAAGALAFTTGAPTALIGVMVAVALLPPLATVGLLLGSGHFGDAEGAALLLATNVVCVNLAGVVTFLAQGVRPQSWWEAAQARKAVRVAVILWTILLVLLAVLILVAQERGAPLLEEDDGSGSPAVAAGTSRAVSRDASGRSLCPIAQA
jgi:uncharacterized hydrophobic protein (TIGR00341 family)